MLIIATFMGEPKVTGLIDPAQPYDAVAANPPLTIEAMKQAYGWVERIGQHGPFDRCYTGRTARTVCTASVFALAFKIELETLEPLTIYANGEGGKRVCYPEYRREGEDYDQWRVNLRAVLWEIERRHRPDDKVILVCHDPQMALLAEMTGTPLEEARASVKSWREKGFLVFEFSNGKLS